LIQRLVAAAIGLAFLLPAVIFGGELAVEIIVPLAALVCLYEYGAMAFPGDRPSQGVVGIGWAALYGAILYAPPEGILVALAAVTVGAMMFATFRPLDLERAADRLGRLLLGVFWIGLLAFLVLLRRSEHGLAWVFLVLASSWLGDTGGYFAGKYLGRRPLYPLVSPKKTWEGVFGGITLATVGAFCVRAAGLPELSVLDCLVLGPMLCGLGVVGDLSESLLKRAFQVKDSGIIMPGHGGLLDRIDSVIFVAPALYAWLIFVEG
jgi:phosphatidate cytidylyltransferase